MLEEETRRAELEIEEIKKVGKSKVGKVWEIKKKIVNGKKRAIEATAIVNPQTKQLVVSRKDIKIVTLNYCKDTLRNNEPEEGFEDLMEKKKEIVKEGFQRMQLLNAASY